MCVVYWCIVCVLVCWLTSECMLCVLCMCLCVYVCVGVYCVFVCECVISDRSISELGEDSGSVCSVCVWCVYVCGVCSQVQMIYIYCTVPIVVPALQQLNTNLTELGWMCEDSE